jgi:hypothetical protein
MMELTQLTMSTMMMLMTIQMTMMAVTIIVNYYVVVAEGCSRATSAVVGEGPSPAPAPSCLVQNTTYRKEHHRSLHYFHGLKDKFTSKF